MFASVGRKQRLARLFREPKVVWMPVDDSLLSGPNLGLKHLGRTVAAAVEADIGAVIGFRGARFHLQSVLGETPFLLNLSASTTQVDHTRKCLIGRVEDALACDATGVALHVNISSRYERSMTRQFAKVRRKCDEFGLPLLGIFYLRRELVSGDDDNYCELSSDDPDQYTSLVSHTIRIGAELGADIIKTQFLTRAECFARVAESAMGVPVVVAGGPTMTETECIARAKVLVQMGAAGICFGRNIYNRPAPGVFIRTLREKMQEMHTSIPQPSETQDAL